MSKANYGTNSSGTGSFPNVIIVNMINVQMNVNSSTIIVQVEYCVYTVTQQAPNRSLGVMLQSAQSFLYFYFLFSVDFAIYSAAGLKCTTQNSKQRIK